MEMETHSRPSDARPIDGALKRLLQDVIDYATLEFEVERMGEGLAVCETFMTSMRNGARTWPEVQQALTKEDFDKIVSACDGVPLRDLLLDLRSELFRSRDL